MGINLEFIRFIRIYAQHQFIVVCPFFDEFVVKVNTSAAVTLFVLKCCAA